MSIVVLERGAELSLSRQLYEAVREHILSGHMPAGQILPPSRQLALELKVSRNVVLDAYEQLIAEGWLESRQGSGTRVNPEIHLENWKQPVQEAAALDNRSFRDAGIIDFRSGSPASDLFPIQEWGRLLSHVCSAIQEGGDFSYERPEGMLDLRQSISSYILRSRGITCPAGRIIITSGATQGISIISRILYRKDSSVVVEDPGNANLIKAISMCGYEIIPVPADELGLQTNLLPRGIQPAYVYVTPSHQFPLGGILPATRRMDLVRYAEEKECYIVEDDYDSEFRYDGPPLSSLYSLAPDRTIYVGTFSKALAPGLRLGYLLLPEKLVPACREMKKYTDVHTASLEQAALALFIDKGKLELHQRKMKKIYSLRRQALINALEEFFPVRHYIHGAATGLHLVAEFSDYVFDDTTVIRCREKKVGIHLLSRHCINKENTAGSLIFGYGHLEPEEIREGIARLAGSLIK